MKTFIFSILVLISLTLKGQPQVEFVSDFVSPVNLIKYDFDEEIPLPEFGENKIWDYSSFNFTESGPIYFEVAETTDFDTDFPDATLKIKLSETFINYYKFNEDEYTYLGRNSAGTSTVLSNPSTYYDLPFDYLNSKTDTYQYVGYPESVSLREYLGYGTLITADGNYSDMTLIHVKETTDATVTQEYYHIMSPLTYRSLFVYWITPDNTNSFVYDPIVITDISESNNSIPTFTTYPNPVTDKLNIDINNIQGDYSISLFSIDGRKIKDLNEINNINISDIAAGNYFIQLTTTGACFTQKIVKL
ncbi:MAG: T9SS type A sorting domain-containing protein [Chitinophagales bacterium]|jgi:hypothetical protein|nr:T9SS type A sorting domain-containing protein [Chitinophagales bacterium]